MKKFQIGIIFFLFSYLLVGCQQTLTTQNELDTNDHVEGFVEPEPSDWVEYSKPVREYMYYRTQAVIKNDINILWKRYPELKKTINVEEGINLEKNEVETLNNGFKVLDANYDIENYERIKVKKIDENEMIVLVHGSLLYLLDDFEETGGEYLMKVFLKRNGEQWDVVKTDEYTLLEYKKWIKQKNE
ncbi:hypothetical protein [Calidifontibacillus erzurumensis]|uniref:Lipoprotein n=2 Tax=Calidifontibacillus erzurumensis TaxID=2741433 RepID=A0A8J8KC34_9BACI|nr:hypothetical protein [Calidifontibacillus erzurumensis]NSL51653.1 hypothetical protein [Calidifontibacillus erzurumensis]